MSILKLAQNEKFRGWLNKINEIIDAVNKNASDLLDKASKKHTSTTTDYGVGNATEYGHIKLSDAIDDISNDTKGISATPLAVKTAYDKAQSAFSLAESINIANDNNGTLITQLQTDIVNKAPIKHSSNQQTYGIGNATEYGHVRLSIELDSIADTSSGVAVAPLAIKNINDSVIALTEVVDKKSPLNHASINDTYGVGDASSYGHVKVSDDVSLDLNATNGVVASIGSLKTTYDLAYNANETANYAKNELETKAIKKHSSNTTEFGIGDETYFGHVKLTDDLDLASDATNGIAPSANALRETYLKAVSAYNLATELKNSGVGGGSVTTTLLVDEDLNNVVSNGMYISNSASTSLNYPYTNEYCISALEVNSVFITNESTIIKQRLYSEDSLYLRESLDTGDNWSEWKLVSKTKDYKPVSLYISLVSGDDRNDGLTQLTPVGSVHRLMEVINQQSILASNDVSVHNIVIYFDEGTYTDVVTFANIPHTIQITALNDTVIPYFPKLRIVNSRVSLSGVKVDELFAKENSTVVIESDNYMSLGHIEANTNSTIYISSLVGSTDPLPLYIHNTTSEDSIFCASDYGRIYDTRDRQISFEEPVVKSCIFECSYYGEISLSLISFDTTTSNNLTAAQYNLISFGSLEHPAELIGDASKNIIEANTKLQGVLWGGGSTSQYLRADGTWETPPDTKYSVMTGATDTVDGVSGLVPAPASGNQKKYLCGDGTWQTIPGSDVTAYVIEAWVNGSSWYRVYSDGWIEQGGAVSMGSGDAPGTTVSLYKNFNTTSYIVSGAIEANVLRGANSDGGLYVYSRTKTNFVLSLGCAFGSSTIRWYACGY